MNTTNESSEDRRQFFGRILLQFLLISRVMVSGRNSGLSVVVLGINFGCVQVSCATSFNNQPAPDLTPRIYYDWPESYTSSYYDVFPMQRYKRLTKKKFKDLIARGTPFVITDSSRMNGIRNVNKAEGKKKEPEQWNQWTCKYLQENFPEEDVLELYDPDNFSEKPQWKLKDIDLREGKPISSDIQYVTPISSSNNIQSVPYLIKPRDGSDLTSRLSKIIGKNIMKKQKLQTQTRIQKHDKTEETSFSDLIGEKDNLQVSILTPDSAGFLPTTTDSCFPIILYVLSGSQVSIRIRVDQSSDSQSDDTLWMPHWQATLKPNDAIIYYPRMRYEIIGGVENRNACTLLASHIVESPLPTAFLRMFQKGFQKDPETDACHTVISDVGLLGTSPRGTKTHSLRLLHDMDTNDDGVVDQKEIKQHWQHPSLMPITRHWNVPNYEDILTYHDYNGDDRIDRAELYTNMIQFQRSISLDFFDAIAQIRSVGF